MLALFDQGPPPPCPAPFNLAAHVLRHAGSLADKTALSLISANGSRDHSFADLERAVRGTGTGLLTKGLKPGNIVLMRLGNTVEFPIAYLGAIAAGLVPVPTSSQLTAPETQKILTGLNPAAVLRDPGVACADHPLQIGLDELAAMHDLPPCDYDMGDPDRLAYIVYTSGTSGKQRAVAHAHRAIWARQMMVDGSPPEIISAILSKDIDNMEDRHGIGNSLFKNMGAYAPAFGMVGTLIGLIQMLQDLSDPNALGVGMATALITTLYGAFFANMFFIPMQGKLGERSAEEILMKRMLLEGHDAIDLTLTQNAAIADWTAADRKARPWVYLEHTT